MLDSYNQTAFEVFTEKEFWMNTQWLRDCQSTCMNILQADKNKEIKWIIY